jgi:hypothetical protein
MNLFQMQREIFISRDATLKWCRKKNLLPQENLIKCNICYCVATFEDTVCYADGLFRCGKRHNVAKSKKKPTRGDFEQ